MGQYSKPQKSRKNKKIKAIDPFYVGDRPADRDAEKYNLPPREIELEEEFSHSVREISRLKDVAKGQRKRKRSHIDNGENLGSFERGISRPMPDVPEFKRRKRETEEAFLRRVDRETMAVIHKAQFEDKYQIGEYDPLKNEKSKKPKRKETDQESHDRKAKKKSRLMERKKKMLLKKLDKMEDRLERELADSARSDALETKDKKSSLKWNPGCQSSSRNQNPTEQTLKKHEKQTEHAPKQREIGKTVKSKLLSLAAREALETEREKMIKLYRQKKQEKWRTMAPSS